VELLNFKRLGKVGLKFGENIFAIFVPVDLSMYEFTHPFEPPVETYTSFYVGILAQKATRLGRLLDPGW
jgi:hypothetical protein